VEDLLKIADIEVNGPNPWDIQILDDRFYDRVIADPSLGIGETYMDGWWECARIDEMITRICKANLEEHIKKSPRELGSLLLHRLFNYQSRQRSKEVALKHYNIGNDMYEKMLGPSMNYSCAYWKNVDDLDSAQRNKMELICRKLMLKPGLKLLDIGCGWGSLAKYAASNFGVEVIGITVSEPQKEYAQEACKGLPVTILTEDYRSLTIGNFDRIVSVGMFEHVGYKNYREFIHVAHELLNEEGVFLLHTIGANLTGHYGDSWINKYIFPNGMLPSIVQIGQAFEGLFVMEDWHNFGVFYDKTLMAWHRRFNDSWNDLKGQFDERFHRMWNYYLLSCAGGFRARKLQLWQIVLTKHGLEHGFQQRDI
jgi:cyclopropane-fatty-acyl-phospholipid synthase